MVGAKTLYSAPDTVSRMRTATREFLSALDPSQRSRAVFLFEDDERLFWHYTPIERRGLPLVEMNQRQRQLAFDLLASGMANKGLVQAQAIIDHEMILGELERVARTIRWRRDTGRYFFSVFGDPSDKAPWSWRVDGHHLSLHLTIVDDQLLTTTPLFFGANPARVPHGPKKGLRILAASEDLARELMFSLDRQQKSQALISTTAPRDIITTNSRRVVMDSVEGLPASSLSSIQRKTLMRLIGEYLERMSTEVARRELSKLEARGIDALHFAWAGGLQPGQPHYYRIHGPSFFVEYDCVQDSANHIHSVWRDLENDFGVDLLELHYQHHHTK